MNNDWATVYREACLATDAKEVVTDLWIRSEVNSEAETILDRVRSYLTDRFDIEIEFCNVISTSRRQAAFEDVPF